MRRILTAALAFAMFGASGMSANAAASGTSGPGKPAPRMLPNRLVTCRLGHAVNVDRTREQTADEVTYDSWHDFALFLPAIPARTTPPPDATDPAEPVNPRTRVVHDPDGIGAGTIGPFIRVIDIWPNRVELIKPMKDNVSKLFVLSEVDTAAGTARLFVTDAQDLATYDLGKIYSGACTVTLEPKLPDLAQPRRHSS